MGERYDYESRCPPAGIWRPDEVELGDGITIVRCDAGRHFRVRFMAGSERPMQGVIDVASSFADDRRRGDAIDDELCELFVAEDFADWALDQLDEGKQIPTEHASPDQP